MRQRGASPNRLSPLRFVVAFGVVSLLADIVYEGARSIAGPYLASLGASAATVGLVTGAGEAVALVLRFATGRLSDRTGRQWALSIGGYAITAVAVPLLAAAQVLWQASALIVTERFGKAVRTPARDTMLAQAGATIGRGWAFALHKAVDQCGALLGPLLVAAMIALGGFRLGFGVLAVPGALALVVIAWLRRAVPVPAAYEHDGREPATPARRAQFPRRFWLYALFTALTMTGFATFGVLGYHLERREVVGTAWIPVVYAVAMAVAAVAALAFGRLYDRAGLRGLAVLPLLAAAVPFLSFSTSLWLVVAGAIVWGAAIGVHDSTMRAAVADLVPASSRGLGYGTFTAVYGIAWLAGAAAIGALYDRDVTWAQIFVVAAQACAVAALVPLRRADRDG